MQAIDINQFQKVKALVIGDIMLDKFMYGTVSRISPEAPVPIFQQTAEKQMLGGAGNVVANLTALGCQTTFIGIVGNDKDGRQISKLLQNTGARSHLLKLQDYPSIVKTRLIASNHHLLRVDQEEMIPVITDLLPKFHKILSQAIKGADIVLISDYNKGILTPKTAQMIIGICKQFHKPVIVDPKGADYSKYQGATLVKPNLKEFSMATNQTYNPELATFHECLQEGAKKIFNTYDIDYLIITLSEHGMVSVSKEGTLIQIPTQAKEVFDVSGAGDTALATLGAALGAGMPINQAMNLANVAAGIVVGKVGTATVSASELKNELSRQIPDDVWYQYSKIVTVSEAENIVEQLRRQGKKIGFTNGCFDCCHLGHLNSFMQAKHHCDVLVVGLNSDESVRRYKGPNRPVQDEKTRAMVLASMACVDYVIIFNEDTPLQIVDTLKPDIVAKEGYSLDKWPEGRLAISYGGQAVMLKRVEGYSTSGLVDKMKGDKNAKLY